MSSTPFEWFRVLHSFVLALSIWLFFAVRCAFLGLAISISRIKPQNLKTLKPQNNESNLKTYEVLLSVFLLMNKTFLCLVPRRQKV